MLILIILLTIIKFTRKMFYIILGLIKFQTLEFRSTDYTYSRMLSIRSIYNNINFTQINNLNQTCILYVRIVQNTDYDR